MNELALFDSLFGGNDTGLSFPEFYRVQTCVPKVDVRENKDAYLLDMDLPGRSDKDIDISLKDGVLTVASITDKKEEKRDEKEDGKATWLIHERSRSSFTRRFSLPDDVDAEGVSASFKDGVLSVRLPRSKASETVKKIAISAA